MPKFLVQFPDGHILRFEEVELVTHQANGTVYLEGKPKMVGNTPRFTLIASFAPGCWAMVRRMPDDTEIVP